jgi:aminoglycoside/choline kinase family phosphotransferase
LAGEFAALARAVAAQPLVLVHRDFQSQNIMLDRDRIGLVDVQGMRLGPVGYDVMSLLHDPYVDLAPDVRRALLDHWLDAVRALPVLAGHTREEVEAMALAAGLQRLMQALGAFGFLGRVKGKRSFLDHVPRGLAQLGDILARAAARVAAHPETGPWLPVPFPALRAVLERCGDGSRHRPLDGEGSAG